MDFQLLVRVFFEILKYFLQVPHILVAIVTDIPVYCLQTTTIVQAHNPFPQIRSKKRIMFIINIPKLLFFLRVKTQQLDEPYIFLMPGEGAWLGLEPDKSRLEFFHNFGNTLGEKDHCIGHVGKMMGLELDILGFEFTKPDDEIIQEILVLNCFCQSLLIIPVIVSVALAAHIFVDLFWSRGTIVEGWVRLILLGWVLFVLDCYRVGYFYAGGTMVVGYAFGVFYGMN